MKKLSGGYKRVLSIAMTILGKSNIIILDEPTANLDVQSQRLVWTAIKKIRQDRTIILATQIVQEAD